MQTRILLGPIDSSVDLRQLLSNLSKGIYLISFLRLQYDIEHQYFFLLLKTCLLVSLTAFNWTLVMRVYQNNAS